MNKLIKTIVLTTAVAATTLSTMPAASAGERHRHHRHERHSDNGDLLAAGIFGLAAGAIASSIITSPPRHGGGGQLIGPVDGPNYGRPDPYYVEPDTGYYPAAPEPRRHRREERRYSRNYGLEPWTREWFEYCDDRYRSFNPRTGTYRGYDGRDHFCTAG